MGTYAKLFLIFVWIFSLNAKSMEINWLTDYEEALKQSKATSKPVLLFFTGSDWCYSCTKLKSEALSTPQFSAATFDKFIFVIIDFPKKIKASPLLAAQASNLQKKYEIVALPTIVLIDSTGRKLGTRGYKAGGGKLYADHLLELLNN